MADVADEEEPEKPMDPEEARKARGKEGKSSIPLRTTPTNTMQVLFLRHRLQKGFLSRDSAPQEEDMPTMSSYIKKLENYEDLEVSIIRETKINKVLKALVKLNSIPRDEEFNFRKRSIELLGKWNKILGAESVDVEPSNDKDSKSTPTTNGVHDDSGDAKKDEPEPPAENEAKPAEVVEKVNETTADESAKATVVAEIQDDEEPNQPAPSVEKAEPAVVEKVPESAEAAAEAQAVVKDAE
jgi:hypothetical protein